MIPLLNIIALSLEPIKNFVSLKTYISQNAREHCKKYFIYDIPNFPRVDILEENREKFFEYLDTIGIEHTQIGGYYFFGKKQQ
jgi:hypothetical protein